MCKPERILGPAMAVAVGLWAATVAASDNSWHFDRVELHDSKVLRGLIDSETDQAIRFLEIREAKGRGWYGVYLSVSKQSVKRVERLTAEQRAASRQRFDEHRNRVSIEAKRMEDVTLRRSGDELTYDGDQFVLRSTAPEEIVKRSVVRTEQIFAAMRQMIPERHPAARPIIVRLYGSVDEYQQHLRQLGLSISNPAVFHPESNTIAVGADLMRNADQLRRIQAQHDALREQSERERAQLESAIKAIRLSKSSDSDKRSAIRRLTADINRDIEKRAQQVEKANRQNEAEFQKLTDRMFRMLYHESLHAYLENFVYPGPSHPVPRWLNEGLAQVFEASTLEGKSFRVAAPNEQALKQLQESLMAVSLKELLAADGQRFLVSHGQNAQSSQQYYAASWGLAHYLTFERNLVGTLAMDQYVENDDLSPVARFERLVGMSLAAFEPLWRAYIAAIQPAS